MAIIKLGKKGQEHGGMVVPDGPTAEQLQELKLKRDLEQRKRRAEDLQRKHDVLASLKRERVGLLTRIAELERDERPYVIKDTSGRSPSGLVVGGRISQLAVDKQRDLAELEDQIAQLEQEVETS
jgi:hypothetical protein